MRNTRTVIALVACILLAGAVGASRADVSNQATQMTFEQPVRIPGQVLPPGTYWFKALDSGGGSDPNRVQVMNADGSKAIAQLQTQTADHAPSGAETTANGVKWPTGKVVIVVAEGRKGEPVTLLSWYYPGRTDGHRFVYTDREQKQLDEETHHTLAFEPGDKVTIGRSLAAFQ